MRRGRTEEIDWDEEDKGEGKEMIGRRIWEGEERKRWEGKRRKRIVKEDGKDWKRIIDLEENRR